VFYGEYIHTLDKKNRVIVPARLREAVHEDEYGRGFFITFGLDTCLFMYTPGQWRIIESKMDTALFGGGKNRAFKRLFFGYACKEECDKQGRILIPERLLKKANIMKEVKFVGVSDHIELWNPKTHQTSLDEVEKHYDELAEELFNVDIEERGKK